MSKIPVSTIIVAIIMSIQAATIYKLMNLNEGYKQCRTAVALLIENKLLMEKGK